MKLATQLLYLLPSRRRNESRLSPHPPDGVVLNCKTRTFVGIGSKLLRSNVLLFNQPIPLLSYRRITGRKVTRNRSHRPLGRTVYGQIYFIDTCNCIFTIQNTYMYTEKSSFFPHNIFFNSMFPYQEGVVYIDCRRILSCYGRQCAFLQLSFRFSSLKKLLCSIIKLSKSYNVILFVSFSLSFSLSLCSPALLSPNFASSPFPSRYNLITCIDPRTYEM